MTRRPKKPNPTDDDEQDEHEATRLKTLAESKYRRSNLKSALKYAKRAQRLNPNLDGISDMVTALKILRVYSKSPDSPDWYSILQVEPFSHINSIKKQYKKLALTLHPDKNACVASEEAFKRVSEANQVLLDKIRRKEYDLKLRIALQSQATVSTATADADSTGTFWTCCSRCQLLHEFDRRYIGHCLRCPGCRKNFLAEEVDGEIEVEGDRGVLGGAVAEDLGYANGPVKRSLRVPVKRRYFDIEDEIRVEDYVGRGRFNLRARARKVEREPERARKVEQEPEMTLAEMQLEAKRKANKSAQKTKVKEKEDKSKNEKVMVKEKENARKRKAKDKETHEEMGVTVDLKKNDDLEIMRVEDSDFYNFDKDRTERCFRRAQIWAVYDDDDGMPRQYGLIHEVESVNPFVVKMSWLDMETNGDERLINLEKSVLHISCGRFKVSRTIVVDSVNVFSHLVQCERVAREIYWIYPKKGSIWALYNEKSLNRDKGNGTLTETRSYNIIVALTNYTEMQGLSMAYLEKVEGFKTIFKRQDMGPQSVICIQKDDLRVFSHQIPARKLSGTEVHDLPRYCWELDPAALPPGLLTLGWER